MEGGGLQRQAARSRGVSWGVGRGVPSWRNGEEHPRWRKVWRLCARPGGKAQRGREQAGNAQRQRGACRWGGVPEGCVWGPPSPNRQGEKLPARPRARPALPRPARSLLPAGLPSAQSVCVTRGALPRISVLWKRERRTDLPDTTTATSQISLHLLSSSKVSRELTFTRKSVSGVHAGVWKPCSPSRDGSRGRCTLDIGGSRSDPQHSWS